MRSRFRRISTSSLCNRSNRCNTRLAHDTIEVAHPVGAVYAVGSGGSVHQACAIGAVGRCNTRLARDTIGGAVGVVRAVGSGGSVRQACAMGAVAATHA